MIWLAICDRLLGTLHASFILTLAGLLYGFLKVPFGLLSRFGSRLGDFQAISVLLLLEGLDELSISSVRHRAMTLWTGRDTIIIVRWIQRLHSVSSWALSGLQLLPSCLRFAFFLPDHVSCLSVHLREIVRRLLRPLVWVPMLFSVASLLWSMWLEELPIQVIKFGKVWKFCVCSHKLSLCFIRYHPISCRPVVKSSGLMSKSSTPRRIVQCFDMCGIELLDQTMAAPKILNVVPNVLLRPMSSPTHEVLLVFGPVCVSIRDVTTRQDLFGFVLASCSVAYLVGSLRFKARVQW